MTLPNFFILGAPKAGTTSLANYLRQHPQVFIPQNKEPNFFILEGYELPPFAGPADSKTLNEVIYKYSITDLERYQALYQGVVDQSAIGDATVLYLYYPQAADRIKDLIPDAKMIVVLRNPIDRAYSHYLMVKEKYRLEPLELTQALDQEQERIAKNWGWDWHYINVGMYYKQLKYYFNCFNPKQFKIFLYEDYCQNPLRVIQEICRHIGVEDGFTPDTSNRSKVAYASKNAVLDRLLNQPNRLKSRINHILPNSAVKKLIALGNHLNQVPLEPMTPEVRHQLQNRFQAEIHQLQDLIQRDLSAWLAESEQRTNIGMQVLQSS